MAEIDPSIALSYRPPNLATMPNLQVQTPLESLARVVSLRSLMQEGQLKGLQLQQLRTQMQEQQAYSNLLSGLAGNTPPTTQTTLQPGIVPQPAAGAYSGGAPPLTAGTLMTGAPQTATVVPAQTTTADASQTTLQPGIVPAPAAPQPAAVTPPAGGGPREPTDAEILRVAPTTGPALIQKRNEQRKAMLETHIAQLDLDKKTTEDATRLALGSTDEASFQKNIVEAANKGYITSDEARRRIAAGFNDPATQEWLNNAQMATVTRDKRQEMEIARATEARNVLQFGPQYAKNVADQRQAERQGAAQTIDTVQDRSQLPAWFAKQGPTVMETYGGLAASNMPLDQIKAYIKRGGEEKVQQARDIEAAKQTAELAPYQQLIEDVRSGKTLLQNLDEDTQKKITPYLNPPAGGAASQAQPQPPAGGTATGAAPASGAAAAPQSGAPAPAPVKFGKLISDAERERLGDYDRAQTILQNTLNRINGYVPDKNGVDTSEKTADYMGPAEGLKANFPWATLHQNVQSSLATQQQELKKFISNGSLRGLTEQKLDQMFPTNRSTPEHATAVIHDLMNTIALERQSYLTKDLAGKVLPPEMQPSAPSAPAKTKSSPAGPSLVKRSLEPVPPEAQKALSDPKVEGGKVHTLQNGMRFYKGTDGKIVRVE